MFAYNLSQCLIEYELILNSPTYIGGALKPLYKSIPKNDKSRGKDYCLFSQKGSERDSDLDLSLFYPVFTHNEEFWRFLIPSRSIKGLIRDYCHTFLEDILNEENKTINEKWKNDPVCGNIFIRQTFGTTEQKGLISFSNAMGTSIKTNQAKYSDKKDLQDRDGTPKRDTELRLITQNKLDRITMATTQGLRTFGTLDTNQKLEGRFELKNFPWWAVGLLGIGISGVNRGDVRIGGKTGIGFGSGKINIKNIFLSYHTKVSITQDANEIKFPGIGKIITSMNLKFNFLRASRKKFEDADYKLPPLFFIIDDEELMLSKNMTQSIENPSQFYNKIIKIDDKDTFFKKAIQKTKDAFIHLTSEG